MMDTVSAVDKTTLSVAHTNCMALSVSSLQTCHLEATAAARYRA